MKCDLLKEYCFLELNQNLAAAPGDWATVLGLVIAGAGVLLAFLKWVAPFLYKKLWVERRDKARVYTWLSQNTQDKGGKQSATTREIASWTNLSEKRTHDACDAHSEVFPVTDGDKEQWSIYSRKLKSPYEDHDVRWLD